MGGGYPRKHAVHTRNTIDSGKHHFHTGVLFMLYPPHIKRCVHIKTNGVQCGSPALKGQTHCYFHLQATALHTYQFGGYENKTPLTLPLLEDAESIQIALQRVTYWLLNGQIDARTAGLVLYALQTASTNLKRAAFEPKLPTTVVIDTGDANCPVGGTAWSPNEDCQYEDVEKVLREHKKREESTDEEVDNSGESLAKVLLERLGLPEVPFDEPQPV